MKSSLFIGMMLNASLDIAENKKKIELQIQLCAIVVINDSQDGTVHNCIAQFLNEKGIDFARVSGLGSDWTSVKYLMQVYN
jgi:hypothetical protein